jgi:hypothetical protein
VFARGDSLPPPVTLFPNCQVGSYEVTTAIPDSKKYTRSADATYRHSIGAAAAAEARGIIVVFEIEVHLLTV